MALKYRKSHEPESEEVAQETIPKEEEETEEPTLAKNPKLKQAAGSENNSLLVQTFAGFLLIYLIADMVTIGFYADSSWFLDWWDLIGTVSYIKCRASQYSLRNPKNLRPFWILYLVINSFILFEGNGIVTKSILRKTIYLPVFPAAIISHIIWGFIPVHFFPGDYLANLCEKNDIHQVIVCVFWGLGKSRSLLKTMTIASSVNHYHIIPMLVLGIVSCESSTIMSKFDVGLTSYPFHEAAKNFPRGLLKWITGTSVMSSVFASAFAITAVKTRGLPFVWLVFSMLTFCACSYRYSHGLLEKVVKQGLNNPSFMRFVKALGENPDELSAIVPSGPELMHMYGDAIVEGVNATKEITGKESDMVVKWFDGKVPKRKRSPSSKMKDQ